MGKWAKIRTVLFKCAACGLEKEGRAWRSKAVRNGRRYCSSKCASPHVRARDPMERFLEKVNKHTLSGCWQWTACTNNWGYGRHYENRRQVFAHRWSYMKFVGPVPDDMVVMHACDNPGCVNPKHLSLGTRKENSEDAVRKGRTATAGKKLSAQTRNAMVEMIKAGVLYSTIAKTFEVTPKTIRYWAERETCTPGEGVSKDG